MKYLSPFLFAFLLAAVSLVVPSDKAGAKVCGCTRQNLQWSCFANGICSASFCKNDEKMYPDMASCRSRSVTPAQSARKETTSPKTKVAQVSEPKKPAAKAEQKTVAAAPSLKKQKVAERKASSTEQEPIRSKVAAATPQLEQAAVEPSPQANDSPTSVASATTTGPTPETPLLSALPGKQVLGRRIALVIGNSHYSSVPTLANPAPDARAIAAALQAVGFERVSLKLDLDRQSMWTALSDFAQESNRADWAVIYFAGHGIEVDGQNYVIPTDAKLESDGQVMFETVPLDNMVEATAGARKFRLVILDACRNNPFLATMSRMASTRSIGRGLSRVEPHGGVLVAYAAKAGEVALDGDAGNSPFVRALIEQMQRPGVEVGFLFRKVRDSVLKQTAGAQEPYTYGSLPGDEELYFRPPAN